MSLESRLKIFSLFIEQTSVATLKNAKKAQNCQKPKFFAFQFMNYLKKKIELLAVERTLGV